MLQNLNLVDDFEPDLVAVFGADHIYRMDVNQMVAFHRAQEADVTVAARPVPVSEASDFGVLTVDGTGRVIAFVEKPRVPQAMPGDPKHALVSMGNYLFSRRALVDALVSDARQQTDHDFGKSIIPALVPTARVFAYDFQANAVPGIKPYEEPGYWRDVGTIDAYWRAHMDLLGETPPFDLDNRRWPIHAARYDGPPARIIGGEFENAQVGEGALVLRATIRNSILGRGVWVNEGAVIEDSIVMDFTSVGKGGASPPCHRRPVQHHSGGAAAGARSLGRPRALPRGPVGTRRRPAWRAARVPLGYRGALAARAAFRTAGRAADRLEAGDHARAPLGPQRQQAVAPRGEVAEGGEEGPDVHEKGPEHRRVHRGGLGLEQGRWLVQRPPPLHGEVDDRDVASGPTMPEHGGIAGARLRLLDHAPEQHVAGVDEEQDGGGREPRVPGPPDPPGGTPPDGARGDGDAVEQRGRSRPPTPPAGPTPAGASRGTPRCRPARGRYAR